MAERFKFRLEAVRKLRRRAQDLQQRVVAQRLRTVVAVQDRLSRLQRQQEEAADSDRILRSESAIDLPLLRQQQFYRLCLDHQMQQGFLDLSQRERELALERERLVEASRRLKIIEKLRERRLQRHQTWLRRFEQSQMDEVASQLFIRSAARINEQDGGS